jgi:tetratricopeptide (TPR) repeat protein
MARVLRNSYAGAIADFTEAIRLNPQLAEAYYNRGVTRDEHGDHTGAIADFTEAIRLDPQHAVAYNNRGVARGHKGDIEGAIADFTEAIQLEPQNTMAYSNRGVARSAGDSRRSDSDYTERSGSTREMPDQYRSGRARQAISGVIADYNEAIR